MKLSKKTMIWGGAALGLVALVLIIKSRNAAAAQAAQGQAAWLTPIAGQVAAAPGIISNIMNAFKGTTATT